MATRNRLALRSVVALSTIILVAVTFAPSVRAEVQPGPAPGAQANPPTSTVEIVGIGAGGSVNGFMSNRTPAERIVLGYPTKVRPDWPAHAAGFAGLIQMQVTSGPANGTNFLAYCIDLLTDTQRRRRLQARRVDRSERAERRVRRASCCSRIPQRTT